MRLTAREHPEAVRRYAHVRPAPPWRTRCPRICPGTSHACTLAKGHRGPHVSHAGRRRVVAVWDGAHPAAPPESRRRVSEVRRPVGLRVRTPSDALTTLRSLGAALVSMGEELALGAFFLAFVWFAIDWLLLIFR